MSIVLRWLTILKNCSSESYSYHRLYSDRRLDFFYVYAYGPKSFQLNNNSTLHYLIFHQTFLTCQRYSTRHVTQKATSSIRALLAQFKPQNYQKLGASFNLKQNDSWLERPSLLCRSKTSNLRLLANNSGFIVVLDYYLCSFLQIAPRTISARTQEEKSRR